MDVLEMDFERIFEAPLFLNFEQFSLHHSVETPTKILSFLQTNSNEAESNNRFFKFIERDQCDSLKVKRIPLIHRGTKASVDPKVMKFIFYGIFFCE